MKNLTTLTNKNASSEANQLMEYLGSIYKKAIICGQHTKTIAQEELWQVQKITGKLPALCGFELLGYSPNVNYDDITEEGLTEVEENKDTIKMAIKWAEEYKGIVGYCWHWFSPTSGRDKSFYTEHTDFDLAYAMANTDSAEYKAIVSDIDYMAGQLQIFKDKNIPILWRPLHEAEGGWFWWGAKGADACIKLWKLMYDRYTNIHGLDNLIWVWNSPNPDWYPGNECVDIISCDLYVPKYDYNPLEKEFLHLESITTNKMILLGENGVIPDPDVMFNNSEAGWLSFMTWCGPFVMSEEYTTFDQLIKTYSSDKVITLDRYTAR